MLDNNIFTFQDYKQIYENKAINIEQFERIKGAYQCVNK